MKPVLTPTQIRFAWIIALGADLLQLAVFPVFLPGAASPFDVALDVLVAVLLIGRLGWHWAFAPSFVAELLPGFDLAPTWTIAVWLATRHTPRTGDAPSGTSLPPASG